MTGRQYFYPVLKIIACSAGVNYYISLNFVILNAQGVRKMFIAVDTSQVFLIVDVLECLLFHDINGMKFSSVA